MLTENFKRIFGKYAKIFENVELKIYDDGYGNPTIGIGFILINKIGDKNWQAYERKDLEKLGINLTTKQYDLIKKCAEEKSKGKSTSNLMRQLKKLDFTITPELPQKLLMYSIDDKYNKKIKSSEGIGEEQWDKLNLARQIGVMDHAFHVGNIGKIKESLIAGDFNETAKKIRGVGKDLTFKARAELRAELVENGKMDFEGVYFVKPGDSLTQISQSFGLKLSELKKFNPELEKLPKGKDGKDKLPKGQKINILPTIKTSIIDIDDEDFIPGEAKEVGPFSVRLKANNQVTNIGQSVKDSSIFTNTSSNTPAENIIIDIFERTQGVTEGHIDTKILNIRKEQYNKILEYIDSGISHGDAKVLERPSANETSNNVEYNYLVSADDSASLVQNLYHATGLPLYFTVAYSKSELLKLNSADAKKALESYSSRDDIIKKLKSIYGESKEEVAKMLNLDPEQVSSKLIGCLQGSKFSVKIDPEILDAITSIIDISDNENIEAKHDDIDINKMSKELNDLFLRFKLPPEISKDDNSSKPGSSRAKDNKEFANNSGNYGNFQKLKGNIEEELLKDKGRLDGLLQSADKLEQSTPSGKLYTEQELMSIYEKQIEVLQEKFKNTQEYAQKNPGQYKYEPGEKLPGMAAFNREEAKLSQWLTVELGKTKGIALPGRQSDSSQKIKEKIVQDWNKTIDILIGKTEFNDKIIESMNKIDQTVAIITHEMEHFFKGEESNIAQGMFVS